MQEPSVLDYVKSRLSLGRGERVEIPAGEPPSPSEPPVAPRPSVRYRLPWQVFLALFLALAAQGLMEPPYHPLYAVVLYALSLAFLIWSVIVYREIIQPVPEESDAAPYTDLRLKRFAIAGLLTVMACLYLGIHFVAVNILGVILALVVTGYLLYLREFLLAGGVAFMVAAFATFTDNRFSLLNVALWLLAILYVILALWWTPEGRPNLFKRAAAFLRRPSWSARVTRWGLVILLVLALGAFFRFYQLNHVPGEAFSDQAEKLYDVQDLLNGQTKIFFERNTGREFFQFYLTAFIIQIFHTGISFLSLKIGTALAGFLTLPFIYRLGKEIVNRWVGLLAMLLAGVAYWPNVIARIGLRFPLYPLFVAPTLYFLVRGIRTGNRNDYILSGLALGLGLHGYSPIRILPFVVVAAVVIYLLHSQSKGKRVQTIWALLLLGLIAFLVFLPLFRYAMENPEMFNSRALSRLSGTERPLPGPALAVFFDNTWKAVTMFWWNNGNIWVHSIPNRPALDVVSAALFFIGLVLVIVRYLRKHNWVDLFLLVSIPMLMLPSILSLAFPEENPSLNRTGGAVIPVFIVIAIALDGILRVMRERMGPRWGRLTAASFGAALVLWAGAANFNLVFDQFETQYMASAWNTSEIGHVIRSFSESVGTPDTAYVVPFPYWVDTRLVGINAGFPTKDYALWPENFDGTVSDPRTKLFILYPEDQASLDKLTNLYPNGVLTRYAAAIPGKDFLMYLVPGLSGNQP